MSMTVRYVALATAVLLAGCSSTNISELLQAMANDPASVCVQVNTIYGTARIARTAIVNGNVTCSGDGLSVKSESVTTQIPVKVTPVP